MPHVDAIIEEEEINELAQAAEQAGLRYVTPGEPGYRRKRTGRGFTYQGLGGKTVRDPRLRKRFKALVIPPAWKEVWICRYATGHIQATGRDEKGRKQYIYHPRWDEARNQAKFGKMISFGEHLPGIRRQVDEALRKRKLTREKVVALVVRLMEATLIRIGNPEYARQNNSYGLTTLLNEHIEVDGGHVHFSFIGKKGKEHEVDLYDRRLARLVKKLQELPGQNLFQFVDENGQAQGIYSGDVNEYLRSITGQDFSAKDFRTWGGTVLAVTELVAMGPPTSPTGAKRKTAQAIKKVAAGLRNTPAISRKYYIHPAVISAYGDGSLFEIVATAAAQACDPPYGLNEIERAVMILLQQAASQ